MNHRVHRSAHLPAFPDSRRPPLLLTAVRSLDTEASTQPGREPFGAAASGVCCLAGRAWVVLDDERHLACFELDPARPGRMVPLFEGELPLEPAARKAVKPDLEAITVLPPGVWGEHAALLAFPSGSTERRSVAALCAVDSGGEVTAVEQLDLAPLFERLREDFPKLNVEGAAVWGERLVLLQRGTAAESPGAFIELDLSALVEHAAAGGPLPARTVLAILPLDVGDLAGVPLTPTDVSVLPDGRRVVTYAAEATASTYEDGEVRGSAVAVHAADGQLLQLAEVPGLKLEGVDARLEGGRIHLWLVADPDDAAVMGTLYAATL